MAKVGRKPKPAAVKELAGNPGKRAIPEEIKPRAVKPRVPSHLSDEARKVWGYLAPRLFELGLLTELDREALGMYCESCARWVEAKAQIKKSGLVLKTINGNLVQNPYLSIANKAQEQMIKLGAEFGLSPVARVGLPAQKEDDPLDAAFEALFGAPVGVSR